MWKQADMNTMVLKLMTEFKWQNREQNLTTVWESEKNYKPSEKGCPSFFMAVSVQRDVKLDDVPAEIFWYRRMPVSELYKHGYS